LEKLIRGAASSLPNSTHDLQQNASQCMLSGAVSSVASKSTCPWCLARDRLAQAGLRLMTTD